MFGDWNSYDAVVKAANYAQNLREDLLLKREGILFETVMSGDDKLDFIQRAKEAGYFIRLFFVSTNSPTINASRVANRVIKGGHDVPITKIINRYGKSIFNCTILTNIVDRLYVYDNSEEDAEPKLLFRASNGEIEKQYNDINYWAKNIFDSCNKI